MFFTRERIACLEHSMDKICCLCRLSLPADSRKMKRLHGRSCEKAKQTLQQLSDVPLDQLEETSHPNASLCRDCEKCLDSIGRLTIQLQSFRSQVLQKLRALNRTEQARIARKRPSNSGNNSVPPVATERPATTSDMPTINNNSMSTSSEQNATDTTLSTEEPTHSSPSITVSM